MRSPLESRPAPLGPSTSGSADAPVLPVLPDMAGPAFGNFTDASRAVLQFLSDRLGFGLWMVTRTEGKDWIVLEARDDHYGVKSGDVFQWADSFCSRMVRGEGPNIAPRSAMVPAYVQAPIGSQVPIQAYVGLPLTLRDGSLFGTLCAIDPQPQPDTLLAEQPLLTLLAGLLSTVLQKELAVTDSERRAERLYSQAITDSQTGLYNRRGWDRLMLAEEERCQRYGHPAAVLVVDLNDLKKTNDRHGHAAGDALLDRTAVVLRTVARSGDVLGRLGGDEFGLLAVQTDADGAQALLERLRTALAAAGISAAVGLGQRVPSKGLIQAWQLADHHMYQDKRSKDASADGFPGA